MKRKIGALSLMSHDTSGTPQAQPQVRLGLVQSLVTDTDAGAVTKEVT